VISDAFVNINLRKLMKRHLLYKCIYIIEDASNKAASCLLSQQRVDKMWCIMETLRHHDNSEPVK
jgi:hypothetical protein